MPLHPCYLTLTTRIGDHDAALKLGALQKDLGVVIQGKTMRILFIHVDDKHENFIGVRNLLNRNNFSGFNGLEILWGHVKLMNCNRVRKLDKLWRHVKIVNGSGCCKHVKVWGLGKCMDHVIRCNCIILIHVDIGKNDVILSHVGIGHSELLFLRHCNAVA